MKKTTKKLTDSEKKVEKPFVVTLTIDSVTLTASGDTPEEALVQFKPAKISSKALFTMTHEGKTANTYLMVARTRRVINNNMFRFIFGRRLTLLLK